MKKLVVLVLFVLSCIPVSNLMAETVDILWADLTRTVRGINSIGWAPGDRILIAAFVDTSDVSTTNVSAINYNSAGEIESDKALYYSDFGGENLYARTRPYESYLEDPWTLFAQNGSAEDTQSTNSIANVEAVPFVRNVTLQGAGLTPTVEWSLPTETNDKYVQVFLHDSEGERFWWSNAMLATATQSFEIPEGILEDGEKYTIRLKVYEENIDGAIISQTETFIDFTPLNDGDPSKVYMPVVGADTDPDDNLGASAYFDVDVDVDTPIFIDPFIAVGYDYQIGAGDPLFKSVLLPEQGDDPYGLYFWADEKWSLVANLLGGEQYLFNGGDGIDYFRVLGIKESLGIDPEDLTAFITQLTFVGNGTFTGSMTPIIKWVDPVPEPTTMVLFGLGLLSLSGVSRRRK